MHIMVATDGTLDTGAAVELVRRLYEPDDTVTVFTALQFPKRFLQRYAEFSSVDEVADLAKEAGAGVLGIASGAKVAERAASTSPRPAGGQPSQLAEFFSSEADRLCGPVQRQLEGHGITSERAWMPTENQTARSIMGIVQDRKVDTLLLGSHGQGRFEGPLGSTVSKLVRRSPIPVLVIPQRPEQKS